VKQEIMAKTLLTVRDRKGYPVDAETLVDAQGNDVTDPNTGQPLIVPRNFDINQMIEAGRSIARLPRPIQDAHMIDWFFQGGKFDFQRSYSGGRSHGGRATGGALPEEVETRLSLLCRHLSTAHRSPSELLGELPEYLRNIC